jgi:3-oxoacyl-[acyl-carrier-protein] synthase II
VVVTGLGAVSPIGVGVEAFRDGLRNARSGTAQVTRFDPAPYPCRVAAEVTEPLTGIEELVEARLIRTSSRTTRMALLAAREALFGAGLASFHGEQEPDDDTLGVWVGTGGGGTDWAEEQYRIYFRDGWQRTSPWGIVAALPGMLSSDLSTAFGAVGPSHVLSTGCTSSSDAIGYASLAIATGQCRFALAGGAEAPLIAGVFSNFCRMKAMSTGWNDHPHAASRPFDRRRDGFVLGEGAWFVLLESLESAAERGARPYGRIAGWASTCDAHHRTRNEPSGRQTSRAILEALAMASRAPDEVGYVSLHGSATPLNDQIESRAMHRVFGERTGAIPMSALKSQIGHPQGASGAASLVATLLAMNHGFVPPTLNRDEVDPECDLDLVPHEARHHRFEVAVVNAISFGSKNTALVVTAAGDPSAA